MAERKKVAIGGKPTRATEATVVDAWVAKAPVAADAPAAPAEPMKRLTIDVPASLHSRIKVQCAQSGQKMADVIRALLAEHFPDAGSSL
jgi:hypothetical protein